MTYCMAFDSRLRKNYVRIFVSQLVYEKIRCNCLILLGFLVGRVGIEPTTR